MSNSILKYTIASVLLACGARAFANDGSACEVTPADQLTMEVHRVVEPMNTDVQIASDTCDATVKPVNVDISTILTIGQQIWNIIQAGKPVVNVENPPLVAALPKGAPCWQSMENWKPPVVDTYEVSYKNPFGMTVVDFKYRLQYTYGGDADGHGKYLANVTIVPADISVDWGYTFDANVQAGNAINVGTELDPVAGLDLTLTWGVKTVMKENDSSVHVFVQGNGNATLQK